MIFCLSLFFILSWKQKLHHFLHFLSYWKYYWYHSLHQTSVVAVNNGVQLKLCEILPFQNSFLNINYSILVKSDQASTCNQQSQFLLFQICTSFYVLCNVDIYCLEYITHVYIIIIYYCDNVMRLCHLISLGLIPAYENKKMN